MAFFAKKRNNPGLRDTAKEQGGNLILENSQAELSAIIENIPMAILLIDKERVVREVNARAAQYSKSSAASITGLRTGNALLCANSADDPRGCGFSQSCPDCALRRAIADTFSKGTPVKEAEARLASTSQGKRTETILSVTTALASISGEPLCLLFIEDITERKQVESRLEHLASFPRENPNPVIEIDVRGEIALHNRAAVDLLERIGAVKDVRKFLPDDISLMVKALQDGDGKKLFEREVRIMDRVFFESIHILRKLKVLRIYANDITDRVREEKKLIKANRVLKAVSNSSMAISRAKDEQEYLEKVCRIISEDCGHAMVWIGYKENDEARSVRPVACVGFEDGYLDTLKITWADTERGQGPTGTAIRTGRLSACRDMKTDPLFKPWRDEAMKRGYNSSLVLPLKKEDEVFGSITIYSWESDAFMEEEIGLLAKLAEDVSFGIAAFRLKSSHEAATQALIQSEERYRSIIESANEGIWILDRKRLIAYANRKTEDLLGYGSIEMAGKCVEDLLAEGKDKFTSILAGLEKMESANSQEFKILRRDGSAVWVIANFTPIFNENGRFGGALVMLTDITGRKQAEEEKNSFIAIMSHELRNPLTPILAGSQLISAQLEKSSGHCRHLAQSLIEPAKDIEQQSLNMTRLLDDLLDITRIGQGKVRLKKQVFDLAECLKNSVKATRVVMESQKHKLSVKLPQIPIYVKADPLRIEQIIVNLLNNAAKYTRNYGLIGLEAYRRRNEVKIIVSDNGIGIEPDKIGSIFGLFTRSDDAFTTTLGELGIGLKIAKDLVILHGGSIVPKSEGAGRGSQFIVSLPALPEGFRPEPDASKPETVSMGRQRVLIIDDDASITKLLASTVDFLGHESRAVNDGASGIRAAKEFLPHTVLLDIGMPGMDGYEVVRELRRLETQLGQAMTLIAVTGYGQEEDARRTKEAGFDQHIIKPVGIEILETALGNFRAD